MVPKRRLLRSVLFMAVALGGVVLSALLCTAQSGKERLDLAGEWPVFRGNVDWTVDRGEPDGIQFAALAQINAENVHKLRPAWVYHTGDASRGSTMYSNPIVVDGTMYFSTPTLKAVALDAATGRAKWVFNPAKYNNGVVERLRNRGVAYWKGTETEGPRIFDFVRDRVYAIDAKSGQLIQSFGQGGYIDLRRNLGVNPKGVQLEMTTPGAVYKNLLILGSRVGETYGAAPGYIRAYDTTTGSLKWTFHTIPKPGEFGYKTWPKNAWKTEGGANAWGGITVDKKRGWIFAATGSATDDFYGAYRKGKDLFSDCVLAIDANTGKLKWYFQTTHHDLWDYDDPPAPMLVTIKKRDGTSRDAVVQLTKMGRVFVLDRDTGKPIFPVAEVPVPPSDVPGEQAWPTQPLPLKPPPLIRQGITEADLTNITPEDRASALKIFRRYRSGPMYNPPSLQGTITMPGHLGGMEWGGGSFDPQLNVLYVNVNQIATINQLIPTHGNVNRVQNSKLSPAQLGLRIYQKNCIGCHRSDRMGSPPLIPSIANLDLSQPKYKTIIKRGLNRMPAFSQLSDTELAALAAYFKNPPSNNALIGTPITARRFTLNGYRIFTDAQGFPGTAPPWGTLDAIDMVTGNILWKVPLGEYPALAAKDIHNTGTMSFGGPVATSGGVLFMAGTADAKIRAFSTHSGRQLWEYQLPAGGYATPSVYMVNGREYVAIAAGGGGKNATKSGDSIVAFALPEKKRAPASTSRTERPSSSGWIQLFDGKTLNGWVPMNGEHNFTVQDGAIVGWTVGNPHINSFLCSLKQFGNFELELETYIDPVINSGIQIRTKVRPVAGTGPRYISFAGRVNGPQVEIRRYYKGLPTTGLLYGEALGTGWFSSKKMIEDGHPYFIADGWNKLRIVANGPRIQTWVNGHQVEDYINEALYKTHSKGFIGLQVHGLSKRELSLPINAGRGITTSEPLMVKFRDIRVRPLSAYDK